MTQGTQAARPRTRVLHVITMLELGGAQQNTLHTVRHLDRRRYDVFLATGPGGLLDDEARSIAGAAVCFIPDLVRPVAPLRDLRALLQLTRWMRTVRPDIVHTHSSKAGILGRLAATLAAVPIVIHSVHGFGFTPGQSPLVRFTFRLAERLMATRTTHFVAVARSNVTEGIRLGLFRRDQVTLIRSGFRVAAFRDLRTEPDAVRRELRIPVGVPLVGGVACLKPQKDPLTFAAVAARVIAELPTAHFVLAGDGPLRAELAARLGNLGIADRVHLVGWRQDVERLMSAFDVLLHTSRWEGLPRVLPQAMAAGVPVVATAVDGAPEVVRHGETGFLAAPGDVDQLAVSVVRLLRDRPLRLAMGKAGREVVDEFDDRHLVPAQENLYERLLGLGQGGPRGRDAVQLIMAPGN